MEDKKCHKCGKTGKVADIVECDRLEKHICKDCCVSVCRGIGKCANWELCWPRTRV